MSVKSAAFVILAALQMGGCAAGTRSTASSGSFDRLTREQIVAVDGAQNLYDVVQRLRPRWLQVRAADRSFGLSTAIVVFQDQTFLGDVSALRQLSPELPYEMRWVDGTTASATLPGLGSKHVSGAIVLKTRPE